MGCLWERMPSDATKNLVDALGCLPPFPLCVATSGWERATACFTDSTNSYNQITGLRNVQRDSQAAERLPGPESTIRASSLKTAQWNVRFPAASRCCKKPRILPYYATQAICLLYVLVPLGYNSLPFRSQAKAWCCREVEKSVMAGNGMPLNVGRGVGL